MLLSFIYYLLTLKDLVVFLFFLFHFSMPSTLVVKKLRFDYERFYV